MKFDFLGLKTLTVIDTRCELINRKQPSRTFDARDRSRSTTPDVYELIVRGRHRRRVPDGVARASPRW